MDESNETQVEETTTNDETTVEEETTTQEQATEETVDQKIERLEKENKTLKIQKGKLKDKVDTAPVVEQTQNAQLSQMDVIALAKADIHEEDMERVTKFAQMEGIAVKDALSNPDMQAVLERRAETRQAAAAANTGGGKSSQPTMDGEALANEAQKGNLPKVEDLEKMWDAQGIN
jgi:hypothetical protein